MITLKYIKDEIQKIAEAIEAVLEIDVTIVDDEFSKSCWNWYICRKNRKKG